jgi:hypothetical protein
VKQNITYNPKYKLTLTEYSAVGRFYPTLQNRKNRGWTFLAPVQQWAGHPQFAQLTQVYYRL